MYALLINSAIKRILGKIDGLLFPVIFHRFELESRKFRSALSHGLPLAIRGKNSEDPNKSSVCSAAYIHSFLLGPRIFFGERSTGPNGYEN